MKANFVITGDTSDQKLMTALNTLLEQGYIYKVSPLSVKRVEAAAAPTPVKTPSDFERLKHTVPPVIGQRTHEGISRRTKFFHPSGKTAKQLALEYIDSQGTTTTMDVIQFLSREGYAKQTSFTTVSELGAYGLVEMEGNMLGSKKRR